MNDHDPLCRQKHWTGGDCFDCRLIARVRADEREKFCDCPAAFTRYKATHEAEVRKRIAQEIERKPCTCAQAIRIARGDTPTRDQ